MLQWPTRPEELTARLSQGDGCEPRTGSDTDQPHRSLRGSCLGGRSRVLPKGINARFKKRLIRNNYAD